MVKQRFNWMIAAILTICGTTMTMTSCKDDEVTPESTVIGVELTENPTEDALNVTSDHSYVMYGEFDEDFGHALGRRMQGTMTSPSMADVFVVDPSAVNKSDIMSTEELKTMIRRTESGEASVVLTKATFREFYDWAQLYVLGYLLMELENYNGDHGYDSPQAAPARRRMANIVRNAYIAGQSQTAATRGTTVNGMELDWEHVDSWPAEKQNAVMFDGFAQSGGNELFVMNAAATLNADAEVRHPQNDHEWGHKADAVAHWLNRQSDEKAKTRAGLRLFAQAVTKASGDNAAISDLMNAQTKDFVFDYSKPNTGGNYLDTHHSAIKVQYRVYSAYDFGGNVEYYQVRQNITAMNDQIHQIINGDYAWIRENDGIYNRARGGWMKRIDTKMWLEGNGTKSIMSAGPLNENGTSSGSSSSGGSSTVTTGYSNGLSVGGGGGMSGGNPMFSITGGYSHTWTYSESTGTTWNTTTNWSTKDLTTVYTQGNDANGTVTWQHNGYTPTTYEGCWSDNVKALLKSTCITDEQVLWKVQNPSDKYTLKASFNVVAEICKSKAHDWDNNHVFVTQDNPHEISFELDAPDRFKYQWNNYVINYGSVQGDPILTGALNDYLEKTYGVSSDYKCWAGRFISTEAMADGSDNARAVFQTFKNSIRGFKQTLIGMGYGGRLVFGLKRDGVDANGNPYDPIDQIALALDGSGYNEGETFTEKLNGYDITYKVTKKGSEVELNSVPNDFSGELNIPEKVCDGVLTVTSLGNNSAVRRKGITAVTIPTTIRTIENGALAELDKITSIDIPEGVTTISTWVFHLDENLAKVYLPSTLTEIGKNAFRNTTNLSEVHCKASTPPSLGWSGFWPGRDNATLYVPIGSKDAYAKAYEWDYFKNIVEE